MMMMIAASLMWAGAAEKPEQSKITLEYQQNDSKLGAEPKVPSGRTFWPKAVFYLRFAEDQRPKIIIFMTARKKISRRFFWAQPQLSSFIRLGVINDICRKQIADFYAQYTEIEKNEDSMEKENL